MEKTKSEIQPFDITVRKTKKSDLEKIDEIYKSVLNSKFCMWNENYPTMDDILFDHNHENLFIFEVKNEIIGAISVVKYSELDSFDVWNKEATPWVELSRLVIDKSKQNQGLARIFVEIIVEYLKENGIKSIRLSVAKDNIPALKIYNRVDFQIVGEFSEYEIDFYLCEKII